MSAPIVEPSRGGGGESGSAGSSVSIEDAVEGGDGIFIEGTGDGEGRR